MTNSISLNVPTGQILATWPHLRDTVTFASTYSSKLDHYGVRIQVMCYQNGQLVYGEAGPHDQGFLLGGGGSLWLSGGGPANCQADLYYWSYQGSQQFNPLASTTFDAH